MASSRLFALLPHGERGTHRVLATDAGLYIPNTGGNRHGGKEFVQRDLQPPSEANEFLLKVSLAGEPTAAVDDLAAGLSITPWIRIADGSHLFSTGVRSASTARLAEKRRNLKNIVRFAEGNPALLGQVGTDDCRLGSNGCGRTVV